MPICPRCKKEYKEGRDFCPKCGYYFEGERIKRQKKIIKTAKKTALVTGATAMAVGALVLGVNTVKKNLKMTNSESNKDDTISIHQIDNQQATNEATIEAEIRKE